MPRKVSTTSRAALEKKLQETQDEITRLRRRYNHCQCVPFTEADGIRELRGLYEVMNIPIPEALGGPMSKDERRAVKVTYEDCPETLELMHSRAKKPFPKSKEPEFRVPESGAPKPLTSTLLTPTPWTPKPWTPDI